MNTNKQIILARRVVGLPTEDVWRLEEQPVSPPAEGQVLVKIKYVSLDPAMRGWIDDRPSYLPPVELGAVMRAGTVGEVVQSRHPEYRVGDHLLGTGGVQQYVTTDGRGWIKVDATLATAAPLPECIGYDGPHRLLWSARYR